MDNNHYGKQELEAQLARCRDLAREFPDGADAGFGLLARQAEAARRGAVEFFFESTQLRDASRTAKPCIPQSAVERDLEGLRARQAGQPDLAVGGCERKNLLADVGFVNQ